VTSFSEVLFTARRWLPECVLYVQPKRPGSIVPPTEALVDFLDALSTQLSSSPMAAGSSSRPVSIPSGESQQHGQSTTTDSAEVGPPILVVPSDADDGVTEQSSLDNTTEGSSSKLASPLTDAPSDKEPKKVCTQATWKMRRQSPAHDERFMKPNETQPKDRTGFGPKN